jgi:hypothetical protein
VIKKNMPYRGFTQTWSNRYHFEGDLPPTPADWETFADAIVAEEKTVFESGTEIIEAIGYDSSTATSSNPHGDAVWTGTYSVAGTFTHTSGDQACPGDAAAIIRYSTPARSAKNHPVYLMNYYHGVFMSATTQDNLATDQKSALTAYGAAWVAGFSDGTENHERCGPRGAVALSALVNPYVRHRDFPA